MILYCVVEEYTINGETIDDVIHICKTQFTAERLLCRALNAGCNAYLQERSTED